VPGITALHSLLIAYWAICGTSSPSSRRSTVSGIQGEFPMILADHLPSYSACGRHCPAAGGAAVTWLIGLCGPFGSLILAGASQRFNVRAERDVSVMRQVR
jgi:hypothetical protein